MGWSPPPLVLSVSVLGFERWRRLFICTCWFIGPWQKVPFFLRFCTCWFMGKLNPQTSCISDYMNTEVKTLKVSDHPWCSFENNPRLEGPELEGLAVYDTNCWTGSASRGIANHLGCGSDDDNVNLFHMTAREKSLSFDYVDMSRGWALHLDEELASHKTALNP